MKMKSRRGIRSARSRRSWLAPNFNKGIGVIRRFKRLKKSSRFFQPFVKGLFALRSRISPSLSMREGCSAVVACRAFFQIPLQWACVSVALFYVAYGGLWLAYSLNYLYDLVFFHKECQKFSSENLNTKKTASDDPEMFKKCTDLRKFFGTNDNNGKMTENQALNFGSNFLFGIFTVNMGLILLCGSKTKNQYLVLTFLIGEVILHAIFYFIYFLFRYAPTNDKLLTNSARPSDDHAAIVSWYGNPISGPWRILWEWVLVWLVFAYFHKLCKEEAESDEDSVIPIHLVEDLPKYLKRILHLKSLRSEGSRSGKVAAA